MNPTKSHCLSAKKEVLIGIANWDVSKWYICILYLLLILVLPLDLCNNKDQATHLYNFVVLIVAKLLFNFKS